jgi:hypothetical protein
MVFLQIDEFFFGLSIECFRLSIESTRLIGMYLLVGIQHSEFFRCEEFSTLVYRVPHPWRRPFRESEWVLYTKIDSTLTRDELLCVIDYWPNSP